MNYIELNKEVLYSKDMITKINLNDIEDLKTKALSNERKRARLCTHLSPDNALHEMLIVLAKGCYIRPHKHIDKIESFHMIEGELKILFFDDTGNITNIINMGNYADEKYFYYRLSEPRFHSVIPVSELVVFHEITNGPFNSEDTVFASWSPVTAESSYFDKLISSWEGSSGIQ